MTVIVNVVDVSKRYAGIFHVLEGCSIEIQQGRRIGMVGPNGAGKSTLFRMIAGEEEPDGGTIWRHPGLSIGYLAQEPAFVETRSLLEVALEASETLRELDGRIRAVEQQLADPEVYGDAERLERAMARLERLLAEFEIAGGPGYRNRVTTTLERFGFAPERFEQPVGTLSGGEKKLLGLARLLVAQPDLLLLDEPDNHLDVRGKRELEYLIEGYPGTVVIISHDRYLLDIVVEEIVEVDAGVATRWPGNYSQFAFEKNVAQAAHERAYSVQQREIRRMEASIQRLISWSKDGDLEKTYKRAMAMQKRLDRVERIEKPRGPQRTMGLELAGSRGSDKALEISDLSRGFPTPDGDLQVVLDGIDLLIWSGERVGLVGPNGAGKSVLFALIRGELEPDGGQIRIGPSTRLAYYSQEHQTLDEEKSVVAEIRAMRPMYEGQAYAFLGRFLFDRDAAQKRVGVLSGGEKSRLQFARLMLTPANFLLLDEPTNNLDIPSIEVLEEVLETYEGTVLVISHDRYFLDRVATRIVALQNGGVNSYDGNWSAYQAATAGRGR